MSRKSPSLSSLLALSLAISLFTLIFCISLLLPTHSSGKLRPPLVISLACQASSSPQACKSSLGFTRLALHGDSPARLVAISIGLAHQRTQLCYAQSQALLPVGSADPNLASAARSCEYLLRRTSHVLEKCSSFCDANSNTIEFTDANGFHKIKDMEAWMSGALTWENDCFSALGYVNGTSSGHTTHAHSMAFHTRSSGNSTGSSFDGGKNMVYVLNQHETQHFELSVHDDMHTRNGAIQYESHNGDAITHLMECVQILINSTSNALSLLDAYDTYGANVSAWSPPSRRTLPGYPSVRKNGQKRLDYDIRHMIPTVTVSLAGHGRYTSIQKAVDSAPEMSSVRYVIYIKEGLYNETVRIPYTKPCLTFVGDGVGKTVITGNLNAQMLGVSTYDTATVAVDGDEFIAYNLTIENTAHPDRHQAVALRVGSDRSAFYHCAFLGHQDTLYAHSLRQYYQNCRIEGTIDFIFGNAAGVFQKCEVLIRPGRIASSVVTAQGRTDAAQTTGFVLEDCMINGTKEFMEVFLLNPKKYKVYLGRPWKRYSRTIYKGSWIEGIVRPEGWRPWRGDFALSTLFYGEYNNTGIGANVTGRVKWVEEIPYSLAMLYTVSNFIQGNEWSLDPIAK
ncbi:hypothetical protein L7F22_036151 [Adiantum nelumboides]|nr:hypothetical protein [Adiantum nelumboides]